MNCATSVILSNPAPTRRCRPVMPDVPMVPVFCGGGRLACGAVIGFAPPLFPCAGPRPFVFRHLTPGQLVQRTKRIIQRRARGLAPAVDAQTGAQSEDPISEAQHYGLVPVVADPGFYTLEDQVQPTSPLDMLMAQERQRHRQQRRRDAHAARRGQRRRGRRQHPTKPWHARGGGGGLGNYGYTAALGEMGDMDGCCGHCMVDGYEDLDLADYELSEYVAEQLGEYDTLEGDDWAVHGLGDYVWPASNISAPNNPFIGGPSYAGGAGPLTMPPASSMLTMTGPSPSIAFPSIEFQNAAQHAGVPQSPSTPSHAGAFGFLDLLAAGAGVALPFVGKALGLTSGVQAQTPGGQSAIVAQRLQQVEQARQQRIADNESRRQQRLAEPKKGGGGYVVPLLIGGGVLTAVVLLMRRRR